MLGGLNANAEGMIDINPYVGASVTYDDNVFRFSDEDQAKAAFGSSKTSDNVLSTEAGVDINLHLSRQLISLTTNLTDNNYNHFKQLDNLSKSYGLEWDWVLGDHFFGVAGASSNEALTSFEDLRTSSQNIRTIFSKYIELNWKLHPNWVARLSANKSDIDNSLQSFGFLDQENRVFQIGLQYRNKRATALSLAYREADIQYVNRSISDSAFTLALFGDNTTNKEFILNAAWLPTAKLRLSTQLKHSRVKYNNTDFPSLLPARNFSGTSKQLGLGYSFSPKTNVTVNLFDEVSLIDDLSATYIRTRGFELKPEWRISEKLNLTSTFGYNQRDLLGDSGLNGFLVNSISSVDEFNKSKRASISLLYLPTYKTSLRISYIGERRTSELVVQDFDFNQWNVAFRFDL